MELQRASDRSVEVALFEGLGSPDLLSKMASSTSIDELLRCKRTAATVNSYTSRSDVLQRTSKKVTTSSKYVRANCHFTVDSILSIALAIIISAFFRRNIILKNL